MAKKPKPKSRSNSLWLLSIGAVVLIGAVWFAMHSSKSDDTDEKALPLIATLSPDLFSGKARLAYQAAKDIPEVLVQLPCFCGCMDGLGHKNNLYCFSDTHGNICDVCQSIALDAQEMHGKGMKTSEIRDKIQAAYGGHHSD